MLSRGITQKQQADKRRSPAPEFSLGDEVLVQNKHFKLHEGLKPKSVPRYFGPFKILENVEPANLAYRLYLPAAMRGFHRVFPVAALKCYHRSGKYQPPPPQEIINEEPEYKVDTSHSWTLGVSFLLEGG
jgi:hypothetical protein